MLSQASHADPETVRVYDEAAPAIAKHMSTIGSRVSLIEHAFNLAGSPRHGYTLEIGCGDGRDAVDIAARSSFYMGFDPAPGLIDLALAKQIPGALFGVGDALSFDYPSNNDVIFAFASLLHLNREDMRLAFVKIADALSQHGVLYMTLKGANEYKRVEYDDDFELEDGTHVIGHRVFYYYTQLEVLDLAQGILKPVFVSDAPINGIPWLTFAFARA